MADESRQRTSGPSWTTSMVIGMVVGVLIGLTMDNLAMGIPIGMAVGIAISGTDTTKARHRSGDGPPERRTWGDTP
jgi:F0F1-type ATP synthase assembly protein I